MTGFVVKISKALDGMRWVFLIVTMEVGRQDVSLA